MSDRNSITTAIILTVQEQGENNRTACAFSADLGVFYATLYGGAKSKMRALVQPFNSGTLWLYTDEVRHSKKITDFDVTNCHPTLRTSLYKMWAANLAAELVLKTKCAGDDKESFRLLSAYIDGIDACDENNARLGTIRFLWRYLGLLGVQPDVHQCVQCGKSLLGGESTVEPGDAGGASSQIREFPHDTASSASGAMYFSSLNGFVCSDCLSTFDETGRKDGFALDRDALTYLAAINELSPGLVRTLAISAPSAYDMKRLVFMLIENAAGCKLKSLESGLGIL